MATDFSRTELSYLELNLFIQYLGFMYHQRDSK